MFACVFVDGLRILIKSYTRVCTCGVRAKLTPAPVK